MNMGKKCRVFTAIIHKDEDMYVAECPEVGTTSQGSTVDEALENLREATELYLEEFPSEPGSRPIMTVFEIRQNVDSSQIIRA